jgi:hypothetical protein
MPKGPNGEKRPADAVGLAVLIVKIATGEVDDASEDDGKDPAAKAIDKKGWRGPRCQHDARSAGRDC